MAKILDTMHKLPEKALSFCEYQRKQITRYNENGQRDFCIEEVRKLRGYLQCLCDMGVLTSAEMQSVYVFYATTKPIEK